MKYEHSRCLSWHWCNISALIGGRALQQLGRGGSYRCATAVERNDMKHVDNAYQKDLGSGGGQTKTGL